MLEISRYKYITHKIIPRPTGTECRFTMVNKEGRYFDEVIRVPKEKIADKDLVKLILAHLAIVDHPVEEIVPQESISARTK
jgi:hypothetical protein